MRTMPACHRQPTSHPHKSPERCPAHPPATGAEAPELPMAASAPYRPAPDSGNFVTCAGPLHGTLRREVTACDGTFPGFTPPLLGLRARIGSSRVPAKHPRPTNPSTPQRSPAGSRPTRCGETPRTSPVHPRQEDPCAPGARGAWSGPRSDHAPCDYQLAFFTPGISPCEAISRNWIRLMPKRRMYPFGRPVILQRLC